MIGLAKEGAFRGHTRKRSDVLVASFSRTQQKTEQERVVAGFESGQIRCVVATIGFSMGIDVPTIT